MVELSLETSFYLIEVVELMVAIHLGVEFFGGVVQLHLKEGLTLAPRILHQETIPLARLLVNEGNEAMPSLELVPILLPGFRTHEPVSF